METDLQNNKENNPGTLRLFFAFIIDPSCVLAAKAFQNLNSNIPGIKFNRRANLHLTLLYCGAVNNNCLIDLIRLTRESFQKNYSSPVFIHPKFSIKENRKGGMVWIEFEKNKMFSELNRSLYEAVKDISIHSKLKDELIPHITIARFKKGVQIALHEFPDPNMKLITSGFELWASCSGKNGLIYLSVFKFNSSKSKDVLG